MGRSVSHLSNAEYVLYFPSPEGLEEDGSYNEAIDQFNWDDMIKNLKAEISAKFPSYNECSEWEGREDHIILKNYLCNIAISEYCGLVALSIAPRSNDYWDNEAFAGRHARQIRATLEKILTDLGLTQLSKVGTFSNGESVYQKV